jgi:hypothetical protein
MPISCKYLLFRVEYTGYNTYIPEILHLTGEEEIIVYTSSPSIDTLRKPIQIDHFLKNKSGLIDVPMFRYFIIKPSTYSAHTAPLSTYENIFYFI